MSVSENKLINSYLLQVKRKLPEWLKWKQVEVKKILNDLELQIINEAKIISNGAEPHDIEINEAIMRIGTPESIAREYKRRGTPKFFITEELFEFYLRTLFVFWAIVILISIIISIFGFIFDPLNWLVVLGGLISGIWIGCLIVAIVITLVFVFFSIQGFLPEDFGTIPDRLSLIFPFKLSEERIEDTNEYTKIKLEEAKVRREEKLEAFKIRMKEKMEEAKIARQEKQVEAEILRKEKLAEAKALRKQKMEEAKEIRELKKKYPVSLGELIFGAVAGIIFGLILILQPFTGMVTFDPRFLEWLKLFGLLIFVSGLFSLVRLAIGVSNYTGQQIMIVLQTLYNIAYIPVLLILLNNPEIFPIAFFTGGLIPVIPNDPTNIVYIIYFWVILIIILITIGGMIGNFFKVAKISKFKKNY